MRAKQKPIKKVPPFTEDKGAPKVQVPSKPVKRPTKTTSNKPSKK